MPVLGRNRHFGLGQAVASCCKLYVGSELHTVWPLVDQIYSSFWGLFRNSERRHEIGKNGTATKLSNMPRSSFLFFCFSKFLRLTHGIDSKDQSCQFTGPWSSDSGHSFWRPRAENILRTPGHTPGGSSIFFWGERCSFQRSEKRCWNRKYILVRLLHIGWWCLQVLWLNPLNWYCAPNVKLKLGPHLTTTHFLSIWLHFDAFCHCGMFLLLLAGTQLRMEQPPRAAVVDRKGLLVLGRCFDFWTTLHHLQFQNRNQHEKNKLETQIWDENSSTSGLN